MLAPTCSSMMSSDEPRCRGFKQPRIQFPLSIGTLLARDSIVGIPIPRSVSLPACHFTRTIIVGVLKYGYLSTPNLCTGSRSTPRQGLPGECQTPPQSLSGPFNNKVLKPRRQGPGKRSLPGQGDKTPARG